MNTWTTLTRCSKNELGGVLRLKVDFENRLQKRILKEQEQGIQKSEKVKLTGIPFLDLSMLYGFFPTPNKRFCTGELKTQVVRRYLREYLNNGKTVIDWQGIRAEESQFRAQMQPLTQIRVTRSGGQLWKYLPIKNWTAKDCFDYLEKQGVKRNPLYNYGFSHVGCFPCINWRMSELKILSENFPERVDEIESYEKLLSNLHGKPITFYPTESFRSKCERAKKF